MLKKFYNHLRGSLQIDIYGAAIERFLNICAIHGISFWDVRCVDAAHFTAWVSVLAVAKQDNLLTTVLLQ